MHRLNNMNAAEMNRLAMLHKDQVTWIAFIENVSYKTQLYVLENKGEAQAPSQWKALRP